MSTTGDGGDSALSPTPDWIAATGLRAVEVDQDAAAIPAGVLADPSLSLIGKGLYSLVLSQRGKPIDPYEDLIEEPVAVAGAIEELIAAGSLSESRDGQSADALVPL